MTTTEPRRTDASGLPPVTGWADPTTGLEGPEFWHRLVITEVARSRRYRRPTTVVILELDGLADIPPAWGDDAAQRTLREAAQFLRRMARSSDHVTRIGPARFGILLSETDEIAAINFIERLRDGALASLPRAGGLVRFVFGWASPKRGDTPDAVVRRAEDRVAADRAL